MHTGLHNESADPEVPDALIYKLAQVSRIMSGVTLAVGLLVTILEAVNHRSGLGVLILSLSWALKHSESYCLSALLKGKLD